QAITRSGSTATPGRSLRWLRDDGRRHTVYDERLDPAVPQDRVQIGRVEGSLPRRARGARSCAAHSAIFAWTLGCPGARGGLRAPSGDLASALPGTRFAERRPVARALRRARRAFDPFPKNRTLLDFGFAGAGRSGPAPVFPASFPGRVPLLTCPVPVMEIRRRRSPASFPKTPFLPSCGWSRGGRRRRCFASLPGAVASAPRGTTRW